MGRAPRRGRPALTAWRAPGRSRGSRSSTGAACPNTRARRTQDHRSATPTPNGGRVSFLDWDGILAERLANQRGQRLLVLLSRDHACRSPARAAIPATMRSPSRRSAASCADAAVPNARSKNERRRSCSHGAGDAVVDARRDGQPRACALPTPERPQPQCASRCCRRENGDRHQRGQVDRDQPPRPARSRHNGFDRVERQRGRDRRRPRPVHGVDAAEQGVCASGGGARRSTQEQDVSAASAGRAAITGRSSAAGSRRHGRAAWWP